MKVRFLSPKFLASVSLFGAIALLSPFILVAQNHPTTKAMEVNNAHEPPLMGAHWARDFVRPARHNRSPNMLWHNGAIMNSSAVTVIYWGSSWTSADPKVGG